MNHTKERWTFPGARASCKSSFISICVVILIVLFPSYNAVILRKHKNTLRYSVFEQIVWAIDKLYLRRSNGKKAGFKIPKSKTAALPIVYIRKNGKEQNILFVGLDDAEKSKSMKISNGYIAILWIEEKTQVEPADLQNLKISALRGGDTFYMFESYNPPSATRHWCNTEARQEDPHRMVVHTTYLDIPREWLGESILHDIEQTKKTNKRAYENIYLGIATGTGKNVFENVRLEEITDETIDTWDTTLQGIDWGYFPDPYAYGSMHYDARTNTLYVWDELYLWKHGNYEAFEATREHMEAHNMSIFEDRQTADSAEPKSVADYRKWGGDTRGAIKGKGSRDAGFKWLQGLAAIIVDPVRAPHAADEFTLYEYDIDKRTGEILSGYPEGQPDHYLALTRYATEKEWRRAGA
jgi:PBSX family phage terminase large subunit